MLSTVQSKLNILCGTPTKIFHSAASLQKKIQKRLGYHRIISHASFIIHIWDKTKAHLTHCVPTRSFLWQISAKKELRKSHKTAVSWGEHPYLAPFSHNIVFPNNLYYDYEVSLASLKSEPEQIKYYVWRRQDSDFSDCFVGTIFRMFYSKENTCGLNHPLMFLLPMLLLQTTEIL